MLGGRIVSYLSALEVLVPLKQPGAAAIIQTGGPTYTTEGGVLLMWPNDPILKPGQEYLLVLSVSSLLDADGSPLHFIAGPGRQFNVVDGVLHDRVADHDSPTELDGKSITQARALIATAPAAGGR